MVLFSHPKDFTPVCTTELGTMARLKPEFDKRGVKIIGLSVDPVDNHKKWAADIKDVVGFAPNYPMIGDTDLKISKLYGMLPASTSGTSEGRTPADNQTVRNVFVIGPDKKIKLVLVYPMTTGRNFDEVLRVIDSLQLNAKHRVATPANWKQGEDVILTGAVTDDEAKKLYPQRLEDAEALHPRRTGAASKRASPCPRLRERGFGRALCMSGAGAGILIGAPRRSGGALNLRPTWQRPRSSCSITPLIRHAARRSAWCCTRRRFNSTKYGSISARRNSSSRTILPSIRTAWCRPCWMTACRSSNPA